MQATNCYNCLAFTGNYLHWNYPFNLRGGSSKPYRCSTAACSNSQWWYPSCSSLLQSCWREWTSYCNPLYCINLYWVCHNRESGSYHTNNYHVFPFVLCWCELVLLPSGSSRCSQLASTMEISPLEPLSSWSSSLYRYGLFSFYSIAGIYFLGRVGIQLGQSLQLFFSGYHCRDWTLHPFSCEIITYLSTLGWIE